MRKLFVILSSLIQIGLYAQTHDISDLTKNYILNRDEILLLKSNLRDNDTSTNFEFKKIAFGGGIRGNRLLSKQEFINFYVTKKHDNNVRYICELIKLKEKEKLETGGFESIIILSNVKVFTKNDKKELINQIKTAS